MKVIKIIFQALHSMI